MPAATFVGIEGETITSGYRSPAKNRAVGGVPTSFHMKTDAMGKPLARDSVPPPGVSMAAYARELQRLNPGAKVINEGDHVHLEPAR